MILTFAFVGTFISAVGIGYVDDTYQTADNSVLVYIWSFLPIEGLKFSLLECLIFGSTLSATDPVTILAIFNSAKVDPKLYSLIFGESILNDAVSIVMYETLREFHGEDIYLSSLFVGIGKFLFSFAGSMFLGVSFGLCCSLGLKHSHLSSYPQIESCIVALVAYTSYFFSNGLSMSGIVSLLFCGITLKHYAYHTMSKRTQKTTKYLFAVLAQLSENFIFIYLGLNLFTQDVQVFKPVFIVVTAIAVMASRYAAVFPLSELINWVFHTRGQRHEELPHSYQMMLFWAGLRGAVGVALATGFKGENAEALRTTVLVVVVLTVIVFGGTTGRMLEVLGIRVGVEDEDASSDEEDSWTHGNVALQSDRGRRYAGANGQGLYGDEDVTPLDSPYISSALRLPGSRRASGRMPRDESRTEFSMNSDESDEEPLPVGYGNRGDVEAEAGVPPRQGMIFRDGQWFTNLDERYLLPLFSNSVTARRHHAKKARKQASLYGSDSGHGTPRGDMSLELSRVDDGYAGPASDSENGKSKGRVFSGSVSDLFFARAEAEGSSEGRGSGDRAEGSRARQ